MLVISQSVGEAVTKLSQTSKVNPPFDQLLGQAQVSGQHRQKLSRSKGSVMAGHVKRCAYCGKSSRKRCTLHVPERPGFKVKAETRRAKRPARGKGQVELQPKSVKGQVAA
jgi:hypothetical protein